MAHGAHWAHIDTGYGYSCGIRTDGTLWCWGNNEDGDLGIGNNTNQDRPRQVTGCRRPVTSTPPVRTSPTSSRISPGAQAGQGGGEISFVEHA